MANPNTPTNSTPATGTGGYSRTPTLTSSAFVDADVGDTHASSQWQITETSGDYSTAAYDSGTDTTNLVSIVVPAGNLEYTVTYYWHVRHRDNNNNWSSYSTETSFITGESLPSNILYSLLDDNWNASYVTKPTIYIREEVERQRLDLSGTTSAGIDILVVSLDPVGISDRQRGNWTYKDTKANVMVEIYTGFGDDDFAAGQARLYNLMREIRRIVYANIHNVGPYHLLRYVGFTPKMETSFGFWEGFCRISFEAEGVLGT